MPSYMYELTFQQFSESLDQIQRQILYALIRFLFHRDFPRAFLSPKSRQAILIFAPLLAQMVLAAPSC